MSADYVTEFYDTGSPMRMLPAYNVYVSVNYHFA